MSTYQKQVHTDMFGGDIKVDRSWLLADDIKSILFKKIKESKYSFGEVAERLDWDLERLKNALNCNKDISLYELTHIAGAIGLEPMIIFNILAEE